MFRGIKNKAKKARKLKAKLTSFGQRKYKRRVLSLSQLLGRVRNQRQQKGEQKGSYGNSGKNLNQPLNPSKGGLKAWAEPTLSLNQKPIKPIIPPKSLIIILREKPEKAVYNRRIIDYKHCGLLQRYIGLGGKILPRRQTRLSAKQQRYVAKTIKSARVMGLLPFVSKEKGFFR
jgi:small subunit ribosomal protein S18